MSLRAVVHLLVVSCCVDAKLYESNITDFSKCTVYYARSGSVYKDFFEIPNRALNGSLLDFHFSVMSPSDAHILLAPSSDVQKGDPAYEIVIGAGGNTFCDIRRMQKSSVKATVRIKGLLSRLDLQSFWIHMSRDGVIDVGKEGEELPFLTWTDPDPLPLKVFSFSTWPGVEAKWYFDCPRDNKTPHSEEIRKPMLPLEKLRRDLLFSYDPYVRPVKNISNITVVELQLETHTVTLDEYKSALQYIGTVTMSWTDEKLQWNASNYSDISTLHIFRREIWVPHLYLFNAVDDGNDIMEDTLLTINSKGRVRWRTNIKLYSWCSPDDLGRWPLDVHSCDLVLGFFRDFNNMQLIFNANKSTFSCPFSSRWVVFEVESYSYKGWENSTQRDLNSFDPPGLTLHLRMKRTSNSYGVIIFTPFIFIAASLLITFWLSPFGYMKLSLPCLQLILSTMVLIVLGIIIPVHSQLVPNIVSLYSYTLLAIVICIIIETIVINLSRNTRSNGLPNLLTKILLPAFVKMFFCLPDIKSYKRYGNLNESFSKLDEDHRTMWILLGVVIDRIAFFIYAGLAVYAFCVTY